MSERGNNHLPCFGQAEFSPMTEISINLSGTKISQLHTRKRRLSLSVVEDSESLDKYEFASKETGVKNINCSTRKCLQDITNTPLSANNSPRCIKSSSVLKNSVSPRCSLSVIDSHDGDISLYGGATPETRSPESSPELPKKCGSAARKNVRRDYLFSSSSSSSLDCIQEKSIQFVDIHESSRTAKSLFSGLSESSKDEFMLLEVDMLDDGVQLPTNFNKLVSGDILTDFDKTICNRTPKAAAVSTNVCKENQTPVNSRVRNRLFVSSPTTPISSQIAGGECVKTTGVISTHAVKRCKSLFDSSYKVETKRYKHAEVTNILQPLQPSSSSSSSSSNELCTTPKQPVFRRSMSTCSPNTIMTAVQRSSVEPDLIGDFSKPYILPLASGRHQDLKSITATTMAKLIRGEYDNNVRSYKVIDCRYPYEYEGGHIKGAYNYYTKEQIETELFNIRKDLPIGPNLPPGQQQQIKRDIIIFHCEFSAKRGPKLFRFLREIDRNHNKDVYPALHYPETYLLDGGYKRFFESYSELCEPVAYKRMDDPAHEEECRQFRAQKRNANIPAGRKLMSKRSALEF